MAVYSKVLPSETLQSSQKDVIVLKYVITAADTVRQINYQGAPTLTAVLGAIPSQTQADDLLGTGDCTVATEFGATAFAANAFGLLVQHGGAAKAVSAKVMVLQGAGGTPVDKEYLIEGNGSSTTILPNTATNGFRVTTNGNLVFRLIGNSNFDSVTTGSIVVELEVANK